MSTNTESNIKPLPPDLACVIILYSVRIFVATMIFLSRVRSCNGFVDYFLECIVTKKDLQSTASVFIEEDDAKRQFKTKAANLARKIRT